MSPLAEDVQLPCGWVCKHAGENELVFAYKGTFEIAATKADGSVPWSFDPGEQWELTCRERAGETTNEKHVGYATTREAATDTLLSCMERASAATRRNGSAASLTLDAIAAGADRHGDASPAADRPTRNGSRLRGSH